MSGSAVVVVDVAVGLGVVAVVVVVFGLTGILLSLTVCVPTPSPRRSKFNCPVMRYVLRQSSGSRKYKCEDVKFSIQHLKLHG